MTDYYSACVAYAATNGSTDFAEDFVELFKPADGPVQIARWNHDSDKPTLEQLERFTTTQQQTALSRFQRQRALADSVDETKIKVIYDILEVVLKRLAVLEGAETEPTDQEIRQEIRQLIVENRRERRAPRNP